MAALTMGKTRKKDNPYMILRDAAMPGWEWRVLKAYTKHPDVPYARWFCVVTSPYTGSYGDMGDTYISDCGIDLVYLDPSVDIMELPSVIRADAELSRMGAAMAAGGLI